MDENEYAISSTAHAIGPLATTFVFPLALYFNFSSFHLSLKLTFRQHKLQMLLRSDLAQHQMVPKEYDLQITSEAVNNTFVFTEQDLPGFKSKSTKNIEPDMPAWLSRDRASNKSGEKQHPWDKSKRYQPYYRRAIPS